MVLYYLSILLVGLLLLATAACISMAQAVFDMCLTRDKTPEETIEKSIHHIEKAGGNGAAIRSGRDWMLSRELEHLYITSRDGLKLHGIFIRNTTTEKKRVAVLVHGYRGAPSFDFSAAARSYYESGFSLFLPDQRAHGQSEGDYITFGAFERYDIVDWCRYLDNYTGNECEFILSGVSMGATTVLLAAAEPDMIKLNYITADCGFTSPGRIFTDVFKAWYHLPAFPILNFARVICRKQAGFDFFEFSTTEAVRHLPAPITFIHGEADDFVVPQNTVDNFEACTSEKSIVLVPGAEHGLSYIKDQDRVDAELKRAFNTYFC